MLKKTLFSLLILSLIILPTGLDFFTTWSQASSPVLLGIYPSGSLGQTADEINQLDAYLGGSKISIAGTFSDFEFPDSWITSELDAAWDNGYWPLINIGAGTMDQSEYNICPNDPNDDEDYSDEVECTAQKIANGDLDPAITNWAQEFKAWTDGGTKKAYLAPLQEMNGEWIDYFGHGDPTRQGYYKDAFIRIRDIFINQVGVDPDSVIWVFAPNGYSESTSDNFENYYPGDSAVDIVGFSSFNWGDCWNYTDPEWYEDIYEPYLDRMAAMAPGKPIFVVEIASETYTDGTHDPPFDRATWFTDTLTKIGNYPGVEGVLYFNRSEDPYYTSDNCNPPDYSLDANGAEGKEAFRDVVKQPPYGYWAPDSVENKKADFDGDGDTELSVFKVEPWGGMWYLQGQAAHGWGNSESIPVPGDYDGDGVTDVAVYNDGTWYVKDQFVDTWGDADSVPVPGDYDGDGTTDLAVFKIEAWGGMWYIKDQPAHGYGNSESIPVPGDYDGDGTTDVAVYNDGTWYIKDQFVDTWGDADSIPVPGNYDGDGDDDLAVFKVEAWGGMWYIKDQPAHGYGNSESIPVPGNYDGDATTDVAVYNDGTWYVMNQFVDNWGDSLSYPLLAPDTNGDGDPYQ